MISIEIHDEDDIISLVKILSTLIIWLGPEMIEQIIEDDE